MQQYYQLPHSLTPLRFDSGCKAYIDARLGSAQHSTPSTLLLSNSSYMHRQTRLRPLCTPSPAAPVGHTQQWAPSHAVGAAAGPQAPAQTCTPHALSSLQARGTLMPRRSQLALPPASHAAPLCCHKLGAAAARHDSAALKHHTTSSLLLGTSRTSVRFTCRRPHHSTQLAVTAHDASPPPVGRCNIHHHHRPPQLQHWLQPTRSDNCCQRLQGLPPPACPASHACRSRPPL